MHVPINGWINGAWNKKVSQFRLLAEMLGLNQPSISPDDLQELFRKAGSAKVFTDNVQPFLEATGAPMHSVIMRLEKIERELGLLQPLPFMSLRGQSDPKEFRGVAIWPAGITNWTKLRLEQIQLAQEAGATFEHVIMLGSSRKCSAAADRRHPIISAMPEGQEPTERELQRWLVYGQPIASREDDWFHEVELPEANADGRPLSLKEQLDHFVSSGQFERLVGGNTPVYVPSTPNSLYVPLHVRRVLGLDNVWFSQAGARLIRGAPDYWWPSLQDVMTTPNGILRLWVELQHAGCIK